MAEVHKNYEVTSNLSFCSCKVQKPFSSYHLCFEQKYAMTQQFFLPFIPHCKTNYQNDGKSTCNFICAEMATSIDCLNYIYFFVQNPINCCHMTFRKSICAFSLLNHFICRTGEKGHPYFSTQSYVQACHIFQETYFFRLVVRWQAKIKCSYITSLQ